MSKDRFITSEASLNEDEKAIVRKCSKCGSKMFAVKKMVEDTNFIIKDTGILYRCKSCANEVILVSYSSLIVKLLTFLVSLGIIAGILINNYLVFLTEIFKTSALYAVLTVFIYLIILILIFGGFINGYFFIKSLNKLIKYPIYDAKNYYKIIIKLILILAYGFLPWVFIAGMGVLNEYFLHFSRESAIFLIIPCFSPIFFSHKFNISRQAAFIATAFYPFAGIVIMFLT